MKAEFFCDFIAGSKHVGFRIIPESKHEADLLALLRKDSDPAIFDYGIQFIPGEYAPDPSDISTRTYPEEIKD
jgi:hypothetical protein